VCLFSQAATDVIADVGMWFGSDETVGFRGLAPARILDTRVPVGVPLVAPLGVGSRLVLQVSGHAGVPGTGASAVALNVTATNPGTVGYVTVWPCDADRPTVSNLNFTAGRTVANAATVKLAQDGTVCLFSTAPTDVVVDVNGYYSSEPDLGPVPFLVE
jgi:hypothetical protein